VTAHPTADRERTDILALVGPMLMTAALRRTLPPGSRDSANLDLYRNRVHEWVRTRIEAIPSGLRASERTRLMALVDEVLAELSSSVAQECITHLRQPVAGPSGIPGSSGPAPRAQPAPENAASRPSGTEPAPAAGRTPGIRLPSLRELSREQRDILEEAVGSRLLVTGPPGSGKTIMALHRAEKLLRAGRASKLLTFNRVLTSYVTNAMQSLGLPPRSASTYHAWAQAWHREAFGEPYPTRNADRFDIDWRSILINIRQAPEQEGHYLFIDEGQDLPTDFYEFLEWMRPTDLTVFADENQRITSINSTVRDIMGALDIPEEDIIHLTKNYRNTRPIAEVAACFHVRGIDTGIPDLPDRNGTTPAYVVRRGLEAQCAYIGQYARNNPSIEVGVFVQRKDSQEQVLSCIRDHAQGIPVQMYMSGDGQHNDAAALRMGIAGVKVLNDKSAKGTEFDTVFLVDVDRRRTRSPDEDAMTMFVLCSRPRSELYFLGSTPGLPALLAPARHLIRLAGGT